MLTPESAKEPTAHKTAIGAFASQVYAVHPSKFRCNTEALADNAFMDMTIDCNSAQFDRQVKNQHATFV